MAPRIVSLRTLAALTLLAFAAMPVCSSDQAAAVKGAESARVAALAARPQQQFIGLSVADLAKSEAWYRDAFGMKPVFATKFDGGAVSVLENDWLMVELLHQDKAKSLQQIAADTPNHLVHGVFKLGFFVPDLDARLAALAKLGVKPGSQIYDDKANKTRNVFVMDPDGNRWQLFERVK